METARTNGFDGQRDPSLVTVLVVDDQPSFRDALREVVTATRGFVVVGEAESGDAALATSRRLSPHLVIMDKRMPGMDGITACRELNKRHPQVVVVVASAEDIDHALMSSCGAAAFVRKQEMSPRLLREVWQAAESCGPAAGVVS